MRDISNLTIEEVDVLFKVADFEGFIITKLEKDEDGLIVYAESEWTSCNDNGEEEDFTCEDKIVELYPTRYRDLSDFTPGFKLDRDKYIQWALWCGLIEKIDFDEVRRNINDSI